MQPLIRIIIVVALFFVPAVIHAQVLGDPVDVGQDFQKLENVYFIGSRVTAFDTATGQGNLQWDRYWRNTTLSFNKVDVGFVRGKAAEFPTTEYDQDPVLPFSITFVSPRTIRLRVSTRVVPIVDGPSLMLAGPLPKDTSWRVEQNEREIIYTSAHGRVRINKQPWRVEFYDQRGRLVTRTQNFGEPYTFFSTIPSFLRRSNDLARRIAATFELQHDEKIFGCGESFTRFDKRGQRVLVSTRDGMGTQNELMYKPVPFFLSSNGYGMFVHTSAPLSFDFGKYYDAHNTIYSGDENLDLFVFLGDPKDVLTEYTALTGRSPVPPLWSFGFWMSRATYNSEQQVREVARQLRERQLPSDVIHLDTGWFETEWRSDGILDHRRPVFIRLRSAGGAAVHEQRSPSSVFAAWCMDRLSKRSRVPGRGVARDSGGSDPDRIAGQEPFSLATHQGGPEHERHGLDQRRVTRF
ncbi:MAG TPA: TIM-barrel domain-containing protein [Pyrinomonadaceae bacterium]|nr:TIM-barrel domain-containing protein [Pyrinomonadaceae bacterium]